VRINLYWERANAISPIWPQAKSKANRKIKEKRRNPTTIIVCVGGRGIASYKGQGKQLMLAKLVNVEITQIEGRN
jgi:hypothetical protein